METSCKASSDLAIKRVNKWPRIRHSCGKKQGNAFDWVSVLSSECMNGLVLDDLNNRMFFQIQQLISFEMVKRPSAANEFYHVQFLPINPFQTTVAAAVAPPSSVLELVSWVKSCFGSFRNTRRTVMLSLDPAAFAWATRLWATSSLEPPPSLRASWTRPGTSPGRTTSKKPSQARRM